MPKGQKKTPTFTGVYSRTSVRHWLHRRGGYNGVMPTEPTIPARKRRWWQFGLRALLAAMLVVGVGLGLFVRWWTAPFVIDHARYDNGAVWLHHLARRDLTGRISTIEATWYYSNGQKANESSKAFWSPDGKPVTWAESFRHQRADNGDGTFIYRDKQP